MQRESTNILTTLNGRCIAITGISYKVSRDVLKEALIEAGAHISGSVNRYTTLLVVGDHGVGTKLAKAEEMGIQKIGTDELVALLVEANLIKKEQLYPPKEERQLVMSAYRDPFEGILTAEQAIANVLTMVMLELGITKLTIDNLTRERALKGCYVVNFTADRAANASVIELVNYADEGETDAV